MGIAAAFIFSGTAGAIGISAHRGGAIANGVPVYGENTLPAFAASAARGDVLEFDVHVTSDGVPVVIHDDTLTRVTRCTTTKPIGQLTFAQVRACPVAYLGRPGETPAQPSAEDPTPDVIPTLAEVLSLARATGARVAPEIKSIPPTSAADLAASDFDPTERSSITIAQAIKASGINPAKVVVQSFWPINLNVARLILPGAQYSFLTLAVLNGIGPAWATANGFQWVSPDLSGGIEKNFVLSAHLLGRKVTTYTVNTAAGLQRARSIGVDEVITDDPVLAHAVLG